MTNYPSDRLRYAGRETQGDRVVDRGTDKIGTRRTHREESVGLFGRVITSFPVTVLGCESWSLI
jgi:hypothetical protein